MAWRWNKPGAAISTEMSCKIRLKQPSNAEHLASYKHLAYGKVGVSCTEVLISTVVGEWVVQRNVPILAVTTSEEVFTRQV